MNVADAGLKGDAGKTAAKQIKGKDPSFWALVSIMLVETAFTLSLCASVVSGAPIGVDYRFHLAVAEAWAKGLNGMFSEVVMRVNHYPYFSVLHLLLVPNVWLGCSDLFAMFLQVFFYTAIFGTVLLMALGHDGANGAMWSGLLLFGCMAFTDSAIQVRPQTLDMLLLPIALGFYLSGKKTSFLASTLALAYNHGFASLVLIWVLYLVKLRDRQWLKTTILFGVLILPIMIPSLLYLPGAFSKWGGTDASSQETLFWQSPLLYSLFYLGALSLGFPVFLNALAKWRSQDGYARALCLVVAGSLIMLPLWPDRWLQYQAIPFALLTANWLTKRTRRETVLLAVPLVACFLLYHANYWWVTATGNWDVPLNLVW